MTILSAAPLWILVLSVLLLAPPFDSGVSVGDFLPDEYKGKLNPLSDDSIVVEDVFFPSHGDTCHAWLYTSSSTTEKVPLVVMAPGLGTQKDFGLDRYAQTFVQAGMSMFLLEKETFALKEKSSSIYVWLFFGCRFCCVYV